MKSNRKQRKVKSIDKLDFNINPELNEFARQVKRDIDFIKKIELAIAAIFVLLDIACIDKNTHKNLSICV